MKTWLIRLMGLVLCGCGPSAPSTKDAQNSIENWLGFEHFAKGLKLVSFKKTNGQTGQTLNDTGVSVAAYNFEYSIDLQATEQCCIQPEDYTKGKIYSCLATENDFSRLTNFSRILNAGDGLHLYGVMVFEKTESGWRAVSIANHFY